MDKCNWERVTNPSEKDEKCQKEEKTSCLCFKTTQGMINK